MARPLNLSQRLAWSEIPKSTELPSRVMKVIASVRKEWKEAFEKRFLGDELPWDVPEFWRNLKLCQPTSLRTALFVAA
jgi:hypothetical protein